MAAAAPGADAGNPRRMSRAELVKCWEYVFDNVGDEEAMELFMTMLLRDAQQSRKEEEDDEEEERRARVFEPWQPGSAPPPRVERTVVLGLRAPPHLLPRKHERPTPTSAPAADLARPNRSP